MDPTGAVAWLVPSPQMRPDRRRFKLAFTAFCLGFVLSCDEGGCGDECGECQSAIDHMQAKILDNACNPNYMEKARQRIADSCGDNGPADQYVGAIFEWCVGIYEGQPAVQCEAPGVTYFSIDFVVDASIKAQYPAGVTFSFNVGGDWEQISAPANLGLVGRTVLATHGAQFVVGAYPGDDADLENLIVQDTGEKLLIRQSASDWNDQLSRTVTLYMDPDLGPSLRLENFE